MTQANPFADFQSSPFFDFGADFFGAGPVQPVSNIPNPFGAELLEQETQIPFQGALQRSNPTPNLLRQFQGQRESLFNQFQGLFDPQIRRGELPSLRFPDFIGNFDFQRQAFATPPDQRPGGGTSQFAPRTQFLR